jgi:hypothetical protein
MNKFTYLKDKDFSQGRKYIGASDIPTLALLNIKYGQTPLSLWEVMTGRKEAWKGNTRTYAGNELEPLILKWGLKELGYSNKFINSWIISRFKNKNKFEYLIEGDDLSLNSEIYSFTEFVCPHFKHLVAHPDLLIKRLNDDKSAIIEAKSTGFFGGMRKDNESHGYDLETNTVKSIPASVALQCETQLLCSGVKQYYISVMIDTGIKKTYGPFTPDIKKQEHILALAEKFYWHVENDTPPKPETWEDVQKLNPELDKESKTVIIGETEFLVNIMKDKAKRMRKVIKDAEKELDDIKNSIGLIIGENAYLENSEGNSLASAYNVTRENIKLSELKKEKIRVYNKLKKEGFINSSTYRNLKF